MAERRINDHSSWVGKGSDGSVFPNGVKTKSFRSAEGAGGINDYPDSTEEVKRDQDSGVSQIKGRKMKPGQRY